MSDPRMVYGSRTAPDFDWVTELRLREAQERADALDERIRVIVREEIEKMRDGGD